MTDDTLIAQLQARNEVLSSERDACRDESRRLADALADSQVECERWEAMHANVDADRRMVNGVLHERDEECERLRALGRAIVDARKADLGNPMRYDSADHYIAEMELALAGTPAPRPPRDEPSVPMVLHCPDCRMRHVDAGDFATKPHHTHSCQGCGLTWRPAVVATVGVQFLPGFKDAPAPAPDHAALVNDMCDELGAMMRSWMEPHSDGSDRDFDAVHDIREVISRFRRGSPVVGEPSRAEVEREIAEAMMTHAVRSFSTSTIEVFSEVAESIRNGAYRSMLSSGAAGIRSGAYRKTSDAAPAAVQTNTRPSAPGNSGTDDLQASTDDSVKGSTTPSSGAAKDQPQPACPPAPDGSCDYFRIASTPCRPGCVAAERPRQGEPSAVCKARGHCDEIGARMSCSQGCDSYPVGDPAPEAQRALPALTREQADAASEEWKAEAQRAQSDALEDAVHIKALVDKIRMDGDDGVVGLDTVSAMLRGLVTLLGTPAPNIAAAVAELEAAKKDGQYSYHQCRALAHLRGDTP